MCHFECRDPRLRQPKVLSQISLARVAKCTSVSAAPEGTSKQLYDVLYQSWSPSNPMIRELRLLALLQGGFHAGAAGAATEVPRHGSRPFDLSCISSEGELPLSPHNSLPTLVLFTTCQVSALPLDADAVLTV